MPEEVSLPCVDWPFCVILILMKGAMEMTKDILVIARDAKPFHGIQDKLAIDHINIYCVDSMDEAVWKIRIHSFCLMILDIPLLDGIEIEKISTFRQINPMPILVLSEDTDITERVKVLKSGADDFLQKPYDVEECVARIQALLRRYMDLNYVVESHYEIVSHNGLLLDAGRRLLSVNGKETTLTPKEYGILELLMKNRRQIMTYEQIYETVWKDTYLGDADRDVVFYQVGQLRRKIGKERIESVYGIGYRLKEESIE